MLYAPDIGLHGYFERKSAAVIRSEPSLTMCTVADFAYWSGPLAQEAFTTMASTSAFRRLFDESETRDDYEVRITVNSVRVETGDAPARRRDWHIDRTGGCRSVGGQEVEDLSDPFGFPSFLVLSLFDPDAPADEEVMDAVSTEFMLSSVNGRVVESFANPCDVSRELDHAFSSARSARTLCAGNGMITSFSPRSAHRPGVARSPGWRFLLRVGLHTTREPCSAFAGHFVFWSPTLNTGSGEVRFRNARGLCTVDEPRCRSCPISTSSADFIASRAAELGLNISGERGVERMLGTFRRMRAR